MGITKNIIFGRGYQILLILISLSIIILSSDIWFIGISIIFLGIAGGGYEFITLNKFYAKEIKFKKNSLKEGIKYGLLYVHFNIDCIKKYGTKIYHFEKLGSTPTLIAYGTMTTYILISLILYTQFSYYGLIIYLIPLMQEFLFLL